MRPVKEIGGEPGETGMGPPTVFENFPGKSLLLSLVILYPLVLH